MSKARSSNHPEQSTPAHWRRWSVLLLTTFMISLVWQMPASVLSQRISTATHGAISWHDTTGSLWHGRTGLRLQGSDAGQLEWQWRPSQLLRLRLAVDWQWRAGNGLLVGRARLSPLSKGVEQVTGTLPASWLGGLLGKPGAISGELRFDRLGLLAGSTQWRAAGGSVHWQGGPLQLAFLAAGRPLQVPPLVLQTRLQDNKLHWQLQDQQGGQMMTVALARDGWGQIKATQRLLQLSGSPATANNPDTVVLSTRQRLFGNQSAR